MIGITGRRAGAPDDYPETHRHLSSDVYVTAYAEAVARAGGLPVWLSREPDPVFGWLVNACYTLEDSETHRAIA